MNKPGEKRIEKETDADRFVFPQVTHLLPNAENDIK